MGAIDAPPLRIATPEVFMEMDYDSDDGSDGEYLGETEEYTDSFDEADHFHTLNLDAMQEEPRDGHGGGEVVHMAVKNYSIQKAAKYKVLESDRYKYVCRCKQHEACCAWNLRVSCINIGYW
ncbi:hypothetical protein PIB30_029036 [Stylosanthes scabra]|uniref:Transposase MuDR plant domain-containing protein n=1 Tax=Stylosanthes scabra TaxID=79078 RepID=A0ABU6ZBG8_9FABA|nr:hypothetical protein [Stylosanthes scabra]